MTRLRLLFVALAILAPPLAGQSDPPRFDVSSVRPNPASAGNSMWNLLPSGSFVATNTALRMLIVNAYDVTSDRLLGGPGWISNERFDILASAPAGTSESTMRTMLQTLLADRFKLVLRREAREMAAYSLVIARNDARLEKALLPVDCKAPRPESKAVVGEAGQPACSWLVTRQPGSDLSTYHSGGVSLDELARQLSSYVGRPVINRTQLEGEFQFEFSWLRDIKAAAPAAANDGPSLFTALQEQLGLKLESSRVPIDVLVIESVERPTPN